MHSISLLESQIARELKELNRIQGVLRNIHGNDSPEPEEKENRLPITQMQARTPTPKRKQGLQPEVFKDTPKRQPDNKRQPSNSSKGAKAGLPMSYSRRDHDSLNEFLHLEKQHRASNLEGIEPADNRPPRYVPRVPPIPKPVLQKHKSNVSKPTNLRSRSGSRDNTFPEGLLQSSVKSELHESQLSARDRSSSSILAALQEQPMNKKNSRSVVDIGHEQFEKMSHHFREARMHTTNFEDRRKLLVLEKENRELMCEVIRQAKESEKESAALRECTFTPKKSAHQKRSASKTRHSGISEKPVYERSRDWELERQTKLDIVRRSKEKIEEACTFKPCTTVLKQQIIQEYPKELRESSFMQEALANYYDRMSKARSKSPSKLTPNKSRRLVGRRASVVGPPSRLEERFEARRSIEVRRERLRDAVKSKFQRKRVQLHDQLMNMSAMSK